MSLISTPCAHVRDQQRSDVRRVRIDPGRGRRGRFACGHVERAGRCDPGGDRRRHRARSKPRERSSQSLRPGGGGSGWSHDEIATRRGEGTMITDLRRERTVVRRVRVHPAVPRFPRARASSSSGERGTTTYRSPMRLVSAPAKQPRTATTACATATTKINSMGIIPAGSTIGCTLVAAQSPAQPVRVTITYSFSVGLPGFFGVPGFRSRFHDSRQREGAARMRGNRPQLRAEDGQVIVFVVAILVVADRHGRARHRRRLMVQGPAPSTDGRRCGRARRRPELAVVSDDRAVDRQHIRAGQLQRGDRGGHVPDQPLTLWCQPGIRVIRARPHRAPSPRSMARLQQRERQRESDGGCTVPA